MSANSATIEEAKLECGSLSPQPGISSLRLCCIDVNAEGVGSIQRERVLTKWIGEGMNRWGKALDCSVDEVAGMAGKTVG
jgi:hypothetical protein